VLPMAQALTVAKERDLDLVEVDPHGSPPVCRLLDFGTWRYQQAKKEREGRKHQKGLMVHEVRMRPHIGEHDMERKVRLAERFLREGDRVKVTVMYRGREMAHLETGRAVLDRVLEHLKEVAAIDRQANMEGRFLSIILAPTNKKVLKPAQIAGEQGLAQT
jgi:translation initiation factor IF-3